MPVNSLIIGVDLVPIRPIPRVITIQSDITTDKCRSAIRQHLKTWRVDTILHDGAPNVGTAWIQDAFSQAELVLQAMKLATDMLIPGGTFVTKIFRSKDYNSLLWVFNQLFGKVEATKPPSSRDVSAEIFVVCRDFKAPKRIDPKFLDPRSVFAELADPTPNNEAKVFKPDMKKRKREGYEEGDYTQFKEAPVSEFIQTRDPIAMLGSMSKLSFEQRPSGDLALAAISRLPETTAEIRQCCADLKVLGRKEFKALLKWRLLVREKYGLGSRKQKESENETEEVAEVEPMDEELRIQEELHRLKEKETAQRKRERRRENERKQKEIMRMQLHMTVPMEIGLEQAGPTGEDSMFSLKAVDKAGALDRVARGRMGIVVESQSRNHENDSNSESGGAESDSSEDQLERELDSLYEQYQACRSEADAKYRAKKARREDEDGDWEGFSESNVSSDHETVDKDSDDDSSDLEDDSRPKRLTNDYDSQLNEKTGLTRRAEMFFEQDIFKSLHGDFGDDNEKTQNLSVSVTGNENDVTRSNSLSDVDGDVTPEERDTETTGATSEMENPDEEDEPSKAESEENGFDVVRRSQDDRDWEEREEPRKNGRLNIDIITAEAMTLAQKVASGETTRAQLMDDGFNKYAFRDRDGLPEWFLDDEDKHSRPQRPITAAAAAAIKEKLRAMNARPIKKVREAKDRKRFKAARRLEKLRKKSALLAEDEDMTEGDKARSIAKMLSKASKKKPKKQVKVVVARGGNRGVPGRPRGVKGKYKIVDARLKKDVRAEKRLAKKRK